MDELSAAPFLWLAALLVPLLPALSLATALIERSGPIRLRHWVEEAGGSLRRLWEEPRGFAAYRYLLNLFAKVLPLVLCLVLGFGFARLNVPHAYAIAGLVAAGGIATSELVSRFLLRRDPERALERFTWFYRMMLGVSAPAVSLLAMLVPRPGTVEEAAADEDEASEEEVEAFIDVGTQEGILEPEDRDLVWGVVDFGDTQVRSVMTPRVDMVCGRVDDSLDHLAELFIASSYSRLPLFRESIDQIAGVLHLRDLFRALRASPRPAPASLLKPAVFVPETKHLGDLLKDLQARRQQLAIVVDEFGGTSGLVTIEDLLEEIVGEIADEHDEEVPENRLLEDGSLLLDGRASISKLAEVFGVAPEGGDIETVGGLVSSRLGYVPAPGEAVEELGLRFEVEKADERRILSLRVRRLEEPVDPEAALE